MRRLTKREREDAIGGGRAVLAVMRGLQTTHAIAGANAEWACKCGAKGQHGKGRTADDHFAEQYGRVLMAIVPIPRLRECRRVAHSRQKPSDLDKRILREIEESPERYADCCEARGLP